MKTPLVVSSQILKIWENSLHRYSRGVRTFKDILEQHRTATIGLWRSYNGERSALGRAPITDVRIVGPYLLGFHISNFARISSLLERAKSRGLQAPKDATRVQMIDLGCGTGAASLAFLNSFSKEKFELQIELLDRSRHLLKCAEEQILEFNKDVKVKSLQCEVTEPKALHLHRKWIERDCHLNILIISYLWNELATHPKKRGALYESLVAWGACPRPTWLAVAEPSTETSARAVMQLRNYLCEDGWQVLYPCPASNQCPMGTGDRDWCYSEFDYESPKMTLPIEKMLGVSRSRLGTASYILVNKAYQMAKSKSLAVAVGHPVLGQNRQLLVCNGETLSKQKDRQDLLRGESL